MVKRFIFILSLSLLLDAKGIDKKRYIYENNCLSCHKQLSFELKSVFFDYLLKYSSEEAVKYALVDYLKNPNKDISVMNKNYIRRFGIKNPTDLNDTELKMAIDYYWDKYKVFGKIK